MMKIELSNPEEAMQVVRRMLFLAYTACGGARGMGWLQEMKLGGNQAEEEQVWKNAYNQEDYAMRHGADNEVYGDYVFGRMMKWGCKWSGNIITVPDREFRSDYQSFCRTYPNNKALATAALDSLGIKNAEIAKEG